MSDKEYFNKLKLDIEPYLFGSSLVKFEKTCHLISLLKYSTPKQLKKVDKFFSAISQLATLPKLKAFNDLGYLDFNGEICKPNKNTLKIALDYKWDYFNANIYLLPKFVEGYGGINELHNTDVFIQAMNLPDYYYILFPSFGSVKLRPDALLVLKDDKSYQLIFLEVESEKPDWYEYVNGKRIKYLLLAKENIFYYQWIKYAEMLNLKIPDIKDFRFTVNIICDPKFKADWEEGFIFKESLLC